jgi:ubiquinone/menaquinone biosynthesis C-methylase UbiE
MFHPQGPTFCELAEQALSSTERGYDLLAPKFDYTPFRTPDEVLNATAPYLGGPGSIDSALDIGCGTGAAMRVLRPICRRRVVGLDISQGMMNVARRLLADAPGSAELAFVRGDALSMPLGQDFDLAVSFGMNGHILPCDEPRFVEEVARVLKPRGRFVFISSYRPPVWSKSYWFSRGFNAAMHVRNWLIRPPFIMYYLTFLLPDCLRLLEEKGFETQVIEGILSGDYAHGRLVLATKRPARGG